MKLLCRRRWFLLAQGVAGLTCLGAPAPSHAAEPAAIEDLGATRARPLFSPTRRPPPAPPSPVASVPVAAPVLVLPPPALQLSGVVVGPDRTVAIVKRLSDMRVLSLDVGREVEGWTVTAIRPREVEMRQGARAVTLRLTAR